MKNWFNILKNKKFNITLENVVVQNKNELGATENKKLTYKVLQNINPSAVTNGTLTLPDVDAIKFNAFNEVGHLVTKIVIPNKIIEFKKQGQLYPFVACPNLNQIEVVSGPNACNFVLANGILCKLLTNKPQLFDNNIGAVATTEPFKVNGEVVEIVFASTKTLQLNLLEELKKHQNSFDASSIKLLSINNAAFKNSATETIALNLSPKQSVLVNTSRDIELKHNYPDKLLVNNQPIKQSEFFLNGGRMLTEIKAHTGNFLTLTHIDCTNDRDIYSNTNVITEKLTDWNFKLQTKIIN